MSKTISQLQTSAFDAIANSMNTAAKEVGFENPRITFIYGISTEDVADQTDNDVDCLYPVYVTAQVTERYAEPQSTYYSVTGTTHCFDRSDVICTLAGGLDDLKVSTMNDYANYDYANYDYVNYDYDPVIDALAEVIGCFYDETQLPYHWHRVFETA